VIQRAYFVVVRAVNGRAFKHGRRQFSRSEANMICMIHW